MSSGKSTILNALIGKNYIPSSNRACTAKITSIENDELHNDIFGCRLNQNGDISSQIINSSTLDEWNIDKNIAQINLTAKFFKIKNSITIHDTPGTNFSQDKSHEKITKDFLLQYPLNLILFVINAEHSGTDDEKDLLNWIQKNVLEKRNAEIVFLINKMDSIDFEREDINSNLNDTKNHLKNLGFNKPKIFPISAKAALMFRMMLNLQPVSKSEIRQFKNFYQYFMEDDFHLAESTKNISIKGGISLGGTIYSKKDLLTAIEKTGICELENFIEKMN